MSQEDIDAAAEIIKELRAEEELNPILKQTPASLQLFRDKRQAERSQSEYIDRLERTPIKAAIQQWLTNLSEGTRRNYAYYMQDMIRRNIIPEYDASGNDFTVGHFRHLYRMKWFWITSRKLKIGLRAHANCMLRFIYLSPLIFLA